MTSRLEEEPEPDGDPDEEPEPGAAAPAAGLVPTVGPSGGREYEYRTEQLTIGQVSDGSSLGDLLTRSSVDNWDLVDIIDAGEQRVVVLRKIKRTPRDSRPVGFSVPTRN